MADKWWESPLRIVQTNLQVVDSPQVDPDEVMRYLKEELHADTVVFNAGGIYAYYPTEVPYHTINPFMAGRDLLGEAIAAAHRYGLWFVARVDFSKADDSIYQQRPEWFVKDQQEQPVAIGEPRYGPWSLLYATCSNCGYRNEDVAYPILREILLRYDVDGMFQNGGSFPECYCPTCQHKYRTLYGVDLPRDSRLFHPAWRTTCLHDNLRGMYEFCKALKPDAPWLGSFRFGGDQDVVGLASLCDVLHSEPLDNWGSGWREQRPRWWAGLTTRYARQIMDNRPPITIIHACPTLSWRHTALPEAENDFWLAQVPANGGSIWHTLTGVPATQFDQRILDGVERFDAVLESHADLLTDLEPIAPVAVVASRYDIGRSSPDELFGFLEALTNHQIPFALIPDEHLNAQRLASFSALVLPDVSCLSAAASAAIRDFAQRGGGLVASYETGLFDEAGQPRDESPLADLLGVEFRGHRLHDQSASYMRVEDPDHPLVRGLADTWFIPNELDMLLVTTGAQAPLTLVPPFGVPGAVGSPPERASIPTQRTAIPMAVCQGQNTFFAGQMGRLAWRYRLPDHQDLIANAVKAALPQPLPLEMDGPHSIQATLYRQGKRWLLFLVNGTGERPLQETTRLRDVAVRLRLHAPCREIKAVFAGQVLDFHTSGEITTAVVPYIHTWEVLSVQMG